MKNIFCGNKGISLLEIIVAVGILALILGIVVPSLSSFRNQQILKNTADDIATLLNKARMQTLSSQNSNYYSVHFEASQAVLFTGGTYNQSNSDNKFIAFSNLVNIPTQSGGIALSGGGSNVSFNRLTGDTSQCGTIIIQLVSDASKQKTITINQTGIVSVN